MNFSDYKKILLVVSVFGLHCQTKKNMESRELEYPTIYADQFRLTYFRQILEKSYNHSPAIEEILSTDRSGMADQILTEADLKLIDSLTTLDHEKINLDSVKGNQRAEGAHGKRPLGFIIERTGSSWLDSLAKKRSKEAGHLKNYDWN
jgi:hypothetical protein